MKKSYNMEILILKDTYIAILISNRVYFRQNHCSKQIGRLCNDKRTNPLGRKQFIILNFMFQGTEPEIHETKIKLGQKDKSTIKVEDFNSPLSAIDRTTIKSARIYN